MKKIVIHTPGNHEKMCLETHPDLMPAPGEVVVQTRAAGVNYADVCVRWGVYESAKRMVGWPITPGFEFSGEVLAVGPGANRFKPGERVFGVTFFNGYASQVRVPEKHIHPLPSRFTFEEAAGFPAVFLTAYHALFQLVHLPANATLLVHSAGGGVGSAILQLARARGFHATAVVGSSHKVEYVRSLGAEAVIDKSKEPLWETAKKLRPEGYDAVLDANGPSTLRGSYAALRPTGKLIVYGSHGILPQNATGRMNYLKAAIGLIRMPRFDPMSLITENKSVVGFNLSFLFDRDELLEDGMTALLDMLKTGRIGPPKITKFPIERASEAHRLIESGQSTGKIVLEF
jgi:NADPH:quinone reductase-like Zn-dependent oxidoreductase